MKFVDVLKKRRSIRRFKKRKVSERKLLEIIDAGRYAPSAGNLQNWRFFCATKDLDKIKISSVDDPVAVIAVINDKQETLDAYKKKGHDYCQQSCGAAIQNMMLRATDLGVASCWIGVFDEDKFKVVYNLDPKLEIVALIALGYADEKGEFKRKDLRDISNFEHLD